ncbi:hypothetical protein Fcan01_26008 [Folsomia candida]|uniref:Uncharacterized protein n=1 Tax=Folsomia candida TaxID=158441 RepID=A0A226D2S3_FOLCA|nr:hypothetical protein Fcan01_26008 [Folsomia candida]
MIYDIENNPNSMYEIITIEGKEVNVEDGHTVEYMVIEGFDSSETTPDQEIIIPGTGADFSVEENTPEPLDGVDSVTEKVDEIDIICSEIEKLGVESNTSDIICNDMSKLGLNCSKVKVSRLLFNREKRIRQKNNRIRVDKERAMLGLTKIIRKKHKGKKKRERAKLWNEQKKLGKLLSPSESSFISGGVGVTKRNPLPRVLPLMDSLCKLYSW